MIMTPTIWTVIPYSYGGWQVLQGKRAVNWFPDCNRALNEAQSRNRAELLRVQRCKAEAREASCLGAVERVRGLLRDGGRV